MHKGQWNTEKRSVYIYIHIKENFPGKAGNRTRDLKTLDIAIDPSVRIVLLLLSSLLLLLLLLILK